jgi:hypothetical protein
MNSEPAEVNKIKKDEEDKKTKLVFSSGEFPSTGVQLPYRGDIVARQVRFYDEALALAELPKPDEWRALAQVSMQSGIGSILRRSRPSHLESGAAALLTALAFSGRRQWVQLIRQFFKNHSLKVGLRGRPRIHPKQHKDVLRGILIDRLIARLDGGWRAKLKHGVGTNRSSEALEDELKAQGYDSREVQVIFKAKTIQDAACHLYCATDGKKENIELKGVRNSYARYKLLCQGKTS